MLPPRPACLPRRCSAFTAQLKLKLSKAREHASHHAARCVDVPDNLSV